MRHAQSFPSRYVRHSMAVVLFILAASASVGCTPFSNFRQQCACAARRPAVDPTGCWEGCWASHTSSHNGRLSAIITRCTDTSYHVRFHATFFKLFSYEYEITMQAVERDGTWYFSGQKDLGKLAGGMYTYHATVTPCDFNATYRTCKDHGVFVMHRKVSTCCR
jgi:hypothetical protein